MKGIIKLGKKKQYNYPRSIKEVDELTGIEFEQFVFHYLRDFCDYDGNLSEKNDYGIDIMLWKRDDKSVRYGVQCKRYGPKTLLGENDLMKMQKGVDHYGITYNETGKANLILFTNIPEKQVTGRGQEYILNEQIETYYREDCINIIKDLDDKLGRPKNESNYSNIAFDYSKQKYESFKENTKLVNMLKKERKNIASYNKINPLYLVFNDKTISDIVTKKPKTLEDLLNIHGLNKEKIKLFGSYLLTKILDFYKDEQKEETKQTNQEQSKAPFIKRTVSKNNEKQPDDEFTEAFRDFLKTTRKKIASFNNINPLYLVYNNKTLENIVLLKPTTKEKLSKVYGFDSKNVDLFGDYLVNEIKKFLNSRN